MKKLCLFLLAALLLCACDPEPAFSEAASELVSEAASDIVSETVSDIVSEELSEVVSEEGSGVCEHDFGDEPVEIVGNLYVYECVHCGARTVVPQGTLIGGE